MAKELPFNFGDIIRATKSFEADFSSEKFTSGNLYLVADLDPGTRACIFTIPFDDEERSEISNEWINQDEAKNFELVQAAPRQPKAEVSVDSSDPKTINIKVTLA